MLLVNGGKWPSKASEVYGAGRSGETPQLENPGGPRELRLPLLPGGEQGKARDCFKTTIQIH